MRAEYCEASDIPALRCDAMTTPCPLLCRVSDAGRRRACDIHRWPASESRQGTNPRGMVRGECRALRYGDLVDSERMRAGAQSRSRRLVTRLADSSRSGWLVRLSFDGGAAGLLPWR